MKKQSFFGALAASILLAGCGGGGGGGSNNGGGGTEPVSTPFRTLAPATFAYNLAGTLSAGSGPQPLTASSQRTIVVTPGATANQFKLDGTDALVVVEGGPSTALNFDAQVTQQGDRTLLLRGVDVGNGEITLNTATRIFLPGTFTTNTAPVNQTLSFTNGTTAAYTFKVGGIESVTVPFGTFDAYVVTSSMTFSANNKSVGTYYYVPTLGTYIKSVETITRGTTVANITATLRSQS